MPDICGDELQATFSGDPTLQAVPFVFMTARTNMLEICGSGPAWS